MRKYVKKFISTIIPLFVLIQISNASNHSPEEDFIKTFSDNAISILSNTEISEQEKGEEFTSIVMSSIDLNLISKFVLSKAWKSATADQKERYLKVFKTYFINSYANKLNQYSGEKVKIIGSEVKGKYTIVDSIIVREGTDTIQINLKWRILNRDGNIKIIDLNIEGISLIIAQREEFQSFLANNDSDLNKLILKLENINN
ncbi:MAG: ABC transporter substrate-binding protein [Pelagibacterales bacterium]|nr:ABC transporter substrate-binding protein [Pelagibacterales bacterium]